MEIPRFKIFIISIERNKKRYSSLLEKLKEEGFNDDQIEVFIGIDYKKDRIPSKVISKWGKYTPKSVLACAASHVLLWNHVSHQDLDFALVLEDDSYVIKSELEKYLFEFKRVANDETFLNLSTAFVLPSKGIKKDDLFSETEIVLALDTYILTPELARRLFSFYKTHGLAYHIDLHLTFIKNQIPMKLIHFNKKISKGNMRLESSMVPGHDKKFFLRLLKDTETYKELNTPIIEYQGVVINAYVILVFVFFLFVLTVTFLMARSLSEIDVFKFIFLSSLWLLWGFLLYDMI